MREARPVPRRAITVESRSLRCLGLLEICFQKSSLERWLCSRAD
ncbi:unnamed protein product [Brassica rapa subsp. trilocularis]